MWIIFVLFTLLIFYVYKALLNKFSTGYSQVPMDNLSIVSVSKERFILSKKVFIKCFFEKSLILFYFMLVSCLALFFSHFPQVILFLGSLLYLFLFFESMHYSCVISFSKSLSYLRKRLICKYST